MLDGLGMGVGFTFALILISAIREALGSGTLLGFAIVKDFEPALLFILAPGALLIIGLLMGTVNYVSKR
jgi:electron transport complex protein RnfE